MLELAHVSRELKIKTIITTTTRTTWKSVKVKSPMEWSRMIKNGQNRFGAMVIMVGIGPIVPRTLSMPMQFSANIENVNKSHVAFCCCWGLLGESIFFFLFYDVIRFDFSMIRVQFSIAYIELQSTLFICFFLRWYRLRFAVLC